MRTISSIVRPLTYVLLVLHIVPGSGANATPALTSTDGSGDSEESASTPLTPFSSTIASASNVTHSPPGNASYQVSAASTSSQNYHPFLALLPAVVVLIVNKLI